MGDLNTNKSWLQLFGLSLVVGLVISVGCSSSVPKDHFNDDVENDLRHRKREVSKVGQGEGIHLSEALQKNLKTDTLKGERAELIHFISNSLQLSKKKARNHQFFGECEKKFHQAQECKFLMPSWSDTWFDDEEEGDDDEDVQLAVAPQTVVAPVQAVHASKKKRTKSVAELVKHLKQGKVDGIPGQSEGDYYRAFKRFDQWSPELETLAKKLNDQKECAIPELYLYLGLKAEEFFPSDSLLKSATALYLKADECAQANKALLASKYAQNARFRLGLLSILSGNFNQAQNVFNRLAKMPTNDYTTRALYWSAYCARNDKKIEEFFTNFDELFKTNPLGFHTLSVTHGDSLLVDNLSKPIDPIIKTRSENNSQFNVWIAVIEDLDQSGSYAAIRKLMAPIRNNPAYLTKLDPSVSLYLSTFAFRSKDTMSLFRVLDSVFRIQSEYVVDSTLKLFYPMRHLAEIQSLVKRVNPFLITALVRQESAFQEAARSKVGAVGLMQLMPRTARLMDHSVNKKKRYQPEVNLRLGIRYFENLVDRYQGDVELALAAYNAGPEVVDRWAKRYPMKNRLLFLDLIPFSETRNYVTLIGRNYYWYSKIYGEELKPATGIAQATQFESLK